jgi:hypothetical protein
MDSSPLIGLLADDPKAWGYLPLSGRAAYEVDTSLTRPPFKLHLLGSGSLDIPPVLANIVLKKQELNYTEYYSYMNAMDICLPAFARSQYFTAQASSTTFMTMESDVSISLAFAQFSAKYLIVSASDSCHSSHAHDLQSHR